MPEKGSARRGVCRTRLAGQMSEDTPRPPQETAREYASTGIAATMVRGPDTLTGAGSPRAALELNEPRSAPGRDRGRGARPMRKTRTHPELAGYLPSATAAALTNLVSGVYRFGKNGVVDAWTDPL